MLRVFSRNTALQRMTVETNIFLLRHTRFWRTNGKTFQNMDLRLDDIDARHFFRNGMLDLNTRVHFDEVELARIGIHQEFDRASTDVIGCVRNLERMSGQFLTLRIIEIRRRRTLHHFLITALDRTITLIKMNRIAMRITQNLHFDVTRTFDELFEIDFILAERCLGFALGFRHFTRQIFLGTDRTHTATTTAP